MEQKTAIVTTLTDAHDVLKTFIEYHFAIGFDYIFLFFDDPRDRSIIEAERYPNVIVYRNDSELHALWHATRLLQSRREFVPFLQKEVMARQVVNVEVALMRCRQMGVDWLLHIDIDELFYSPAVSVAAHYAELAERGVKVIRYANHEAIPEKMEIVNYFKEVTLFKKNEATLNDQQKRSVKDSAQTAKPYFNFYSCGKSAARILTDFLPVPATVHEFFDGGPMIAPPSILHFSCCGFDYFWRKYAILGNFANKWFDQYDIAQILPVHLLARDVVKGDDIELGKEFYRNVIMAPDEEQKRMRLKEGIYFRVDLEQNLGVAGLDLVVNEGHHRGNF